MKIKVGVPHKPTRKRLTKQCRKILKVLKQGFPVRNTELMKIAIRYDARISDLRNAGWDIRCRFISRKRGITNFKLVGKIHPDDIVRHVQVQMKDKLRRKVLAFAKRKGTTISILVRRFLIRLIRRK